MLHFLRTAFISPEVFVALALVLVYLVFGDHLTHLDDTVASASFWLMGPIGVAIATSLRLLWQVLFPNDDNDDLTKWDQYPKLRVTTLVAFAYVVLAAVLVFIGVAATLGDGVPSLLVGMGYSVAGVATFSLIGAALTIRSLAAGGK